MKKRYLPFGYQITDGKTTIVQEEAEAVQYIFEEYTAGKSLRKIAENMTARKTPYHEDSSKWNQNMVSRVLANEIYCGNEKYLPIITEAQYRLAEKIRQRKAQTYSTVLQPFRQDVQCGCCGERLYWRPKIEQWFCRQCGMWTKPIPEKQLSDAITIKLEWIQRHSEVIHPPTTQRNVQSIEGAKLTREIQTDLLGTEPNADALIAKILHRADWSTNSARRAMLTQQACKCKKRVPSISRPMIFHIPFIKESLATSVYTAIPTSNSNCEMDKLCEEKS